MKERPINRTKEQVQAILERKASMMRLVVKQVPHWQHYGRDIMEWALSGCYTDDDGRHWLDVQTDVNDNSHREIRCPVGKVGDRLWVRETFWNASSYPCAESPDGEPKSYWSNLVYYGADGSPENTPNRHYVNGLQFGAISAPDPWATWQRRPSVQMPRWASRIMLEITSVRIERLQEIGIYDIAAEGLDVAGLIAGFESESDYAPGDDPNDFVEAARDEHMEYWESIGGVGSWEKNPWTWLIRFKQVKGSNV